MQLFSELRRRNVLRMAALYLVSAWLVLQVVDVIGQIVIWPLWTNQLVLVVLAIGFPIALVISWFYEVTPAGVRRDEDVPAAEAIHPHGRAVDFVIISVLCAAVLVFAYDKWWPQPAVERAIVVRPFENLSGDPEEAYFSDGIADDTRNRLADIKSFKVIAWATARMFEGADIARIASELNVSHVLDGKVRRSGNHVRVTVELIDSADNSVVWSQPFERELTAENLFEIQQEIATAIAAQLRIRLTKEERGRLETVPTHNLQAYDAYLRARQGIARGTSASLLEATKQLKRAIELDTSFATAHAALAYAYKSYRGVTAGKIPEGVTKETIDSLISRALELNPNDGFARALYASTLAAKGDPAAEAEFELALELSPNDPEVYAMYARTLDNNERSLNLLLQGLQFDPKSVDLLGMAGLRLQSMGRPDEARAYYERAIEADPASLVGYRRMALLLWYHGGRLDEPMRWLRIGYSKDPGNFSNINLVGWTYLFLNDDATAERWFRHALDLAPDHGFALLGMLDIYHIRGQHEEEWKLWKERPGLNPPRKIDHLIADGRYLEALELARAEYPGVFEENDSPVEFSDLMTTGELGYRLRQVTWKARILDGIGNQQGARDLLENTEDYLANRIVNWSFNLPEYARVYTLLGRNDDAIKWLRRTVAGGTYGWVLMEMANPVFDRIRGEPEFQQLLEEIKAEMAIQLESVREMERNGELAMLPEAS